MTKKARAMSQRTSIMESVVSNKSQEPSICCFDCLVCDSCCVLIMWLSLSLLRTSVSPSWKWCISVCVWVNGVKAE